MLIPDYVDSFFLLTHNGLELKVFKYITIQMITKRDWVDLRGEKIVDYIGDISLRSAYRGIENLADKKELIRLKILGEDYEGHRFRFNVGLLNYTKILRNFKRKYNNLLIPEPIIKKFKEWQEISLDIQRSSTLIGNSVDLGTITEAKKI